MKNQACLFYTQKINQMILSINDNNNDDDDDIMK